MMHLGIERQTQLIAFLPILVISALLQSYFIYSRFDDLDQAFLERSQLLARQLASSSEYAVFAGDTVLLKQYVDASLPLQDVRSIVVLDAEFNPLLKGGQGEDIVASMSTEQSLVKQDKDLLRLYEPITATQIKLDDLDVIKGEGGKVTATKPLGMVVIVFSKSQLNHRKMEILIYNLLITMIILFITLIFALRIARKIAAPILGMRRAILEIGAGALYTRISPKPRMQELHDLADGINNMASQLQLDRSTLEARISQATLELRAKKEEAERSNFSKTRFLAAASHDLRQPMHAMGLFVGELQSTINTEEQRKIVEKVEESVEAMSGLLSSLLDISKLDAGIFTPQFVDYDINSSLRRIANDYSALAAGKSIKLRVAPCSRMVHSDPVLLERILVNFVSNALRYTPIGGSVLVACRKRGDKLRIEIRDNGIGIPAEERRNIFIEFVQLANKERDRSMGLGLGLAIVERLAGLLQYPIEVRSEIGRGSAFCIDVPLSTNTSVTTLLADPPVKNQLGNERFQGSTILVVEDDPLVRSSMRGILSSWGYRVLLATSLQEVKSRDWLDAVDLLISDYRLSDGTGLDVIGVFTGNSKKFTPCILVSGDTSPDILQKVAESGFNLLSKPVRPAKLRSLILFLLTENQKITNTMM